jgi:hypothetical protein
MNNNDKVMDDPGQAALKNIENLFASQLEEWELAGNNYRDMEKVMVRAITMENGSTIKVQFNPARIRSSAASVDEKSISERPCFLCPANLPAAQKALDFMGTYNILVNPFPIFPRHLTIALREHEPQLISGRFIEMLRLASYLEGYTVFYNGPRCGASAPDHFHFQAGSGGFLPVWKEFEFIPGTVIYRENSCTVTSLEGYYRKTLVLTGQNIEDVDQVFKRIYNILNEICRVPGEPMMNILSSYEKKRWRVFVFPRKAHRPAQFFEKGQRQILISPASVDLGGVWIMPRLEDYEKPDRHLIRDIFSQVTLARQEWDALLDSLSG